MDALNLKEKLYHKIIDFIFDIYEPESFEEEEQKKNIDEFRERLVRWKLDYSYRQLIGPLQPVNILSRMCKVPVEEIISIASNLKLQLPDTVDIREFSLDKLTEEEAESYLSSDIDEESFLDLITLMEVPKEELDLGIPFVPKNIEYIDMTNEDTAALQNISDDYDAPIKLHVIQYLESIIQRVKKGEVYSLSVVSLFNDGKASMWMPASLNNETTEKFYDELIKNLKAAGSILNDN